MLLEMRSVSKSFPGVRALSLVDFRVEAGEVVALMGENGAGKSTLIKLMTGVYTPDEGEIHLGGEPVRFRTPTEAQRGGISTVYQELNLLPNLSVAENILLGRLPMKRGCIDWRTTNQRAKERLDKLQIKLDPKRLLGSCSAAIRQMVAIARALEIQAKILVLDEPTSSLDAGEVERLFEVLRGLKNEGMGIVFVSHFLDQVYAIADRLVILRNGALVGESPTPDLPKLSLIAKMLGIDEDEVAKMTPAAAARLASQERPLFEAKQIGSKRTLAPMDLSVRKGEVLGFAGLLGSGRTEAARLLFGLDKPDSGTVAIDGQRAKTTNPRRAIRAGLGLVPEDRKLEGIIPNLTVRENIVLALQSKRGWLRRIPRRQQAELAEKYIKALRIVTPSAESPVGNLSGGNQQKVILARWLASQPRVLILDEPTRGIDVGAKAEIEALTAKLCEDGLAILLIASDLEELTRTSHRVVVLRDRKKVGELEGEAIQIPAIMRLIAASAE